MLLGLKKRFVEPYQTGSKAFTLRDTPKRMPKIGETIHAYTGLRTKHCQPINSKEKLVSTQRVRLIIWQIGENKHRYGLRHLFGTFGIRIWVDGRELTQEEVDRFVVLDGFADATDFAKYWLTPEGKTKMKARTSALKVMFHWTDLRW